MILNKNNNKTIKFQLVIFSAIILMAFTINGISVIKNFEILQDSIDNIMQYNYKSVTVIQEMIDYKDAENQVVMQYLLESKELHLEKADLNQTMFLKKFEIAKLNITEKGEKEVFLEIQQSNEKQYRLIKKIAKLKDKNEAIAIYNNEILPLYLSIVNDSRKAMQLNQESMVLKHEIAHKTAIGSIKSTIITYILLFIFIIAYTIWYSEKISIPLKKLIDRARRISVGDYSRSIDIRGNNEIAILSREFNNISEKLSNSQMMNIKKILREKKKIEALLESIDEGIIVTDSENLISLFNATSEKIFSQNANEIVGTHIFEALKNAEILASINAAMEEDEYKRESEIIIERANKKYYYLLKSTALGLLEENQNFGVLTVLQDITRLREIDKLKSYFVSTVSHEFRTPLTSILMGTSLLEENPKFLASEREILGAIKEESQRLETLVENLLDLSKMESGAIVLELEEIKVASFIEEVYKKFTFLSTQNGINLEMKIPENKELKVLADQNKLMIIFNNLISNAIKWTIESEKPNIKIGYREENSNVIFFVEDNGTGISFENQEKVFDKFFHMNNESSNRGIGLGLSISREIIELHQGKIWIESKLNVGATFLFSLKKFA